MMRTSWVWILCAACAGEPPRGGFAREVRGEARVDRALPIDLGPLAPETLTDFVITRGRAFAREAVDGVPIEGTWLALTFDGVVEASYHWYVAPRVDTAATIDAASAIAAAGVDSESASLAIVRIDDALELTWSIPPVFVIANGDRAGEVLDP